MGDTGETPAGGDATSAEPRDPHEGDWVEDISDTVAPSVGPYSTVTHHAASDQQAPDVDAMGLDKHRQVVGGSYGPSFARQATLYGGVLAVIAALVIGFIILAGELDKPPATTSDEAPWSRPDASQTPVSPIQ